MRSSFIGALCFFVGIILVLQQLPLLLFFLGIALLVLAVRQIMPWWSNRLMPSTWLIVDLRKGVHTVAGDVAPWQKFGPQPPLLWETCAALEHASTDSRILGTLLLLGEKPLALSTVNELGNALNTFKQSRKPVLGFAESLGEMGSAGMGVTVCALHADHFTLHPGGDLWLGGFSIHQPFLRGFFDKLGIVPDFGARREYKTMRNLFTETGYTPEHHEADAEMLHNLMEETVRAAALARGVEPSVAKNWFVPGWYAAQGALDAGLVHALGELADVRQELARRSGTEERKLHQVTCSVGKYTRASRCGKRSGKKATVALVTAEGAIHRGNSPGGWRPGGRKPVISSGAWVQTLRRLECDDDVKAVVLRIDSPGGSAVASEIIGSAIARLRAKGKPVVASMGRVAASGGYWMAAEANKIVANAATITGSIGVVSGKFSGATVIERTGVRFGHMQEGALANLSSPLSQWNEQERAAVEHHLDITYDRFKRLVAQKRGLNMDEVEQVAQGKVFTGRQALENRLADEIGGHNEAFALACKLADVQVHGAQLVRMDATAGPLAQLRNAGQSVRAFVSEISHTLFALRELVLFLQLLRSAGIPLPSNVSAKTGIQAKWEEPLEGRRYES